MNYSPLEQFQIYPIFPFIYGMLDFSVTNQTLFLLVLLIFFYLLYNSLMLKNSSGFTYIPTEVQSLIYLFYRVVLGLIKCNIGGIKSQHFFLLFFSMQHCLEDIIIIQDSGFLDIINNSGTPPNGIAIFLLLLLVFVFYTSISVVNINNLRPLIEHTIRAF
jgi:hypothetical protein